MRDSIQNWLDKDREKKGEILVFLLVIVLSLSFFYTKKLNVLTDSGWYLARAINLFNGRGYLDTHWQPETYRGPIFMWMIAFYFKLFGPSITSAYLVIRSIFIGNLILTYLIGKKLFNRTIGFISFIFVLTASPIYLDSIVLQIDIAMVFFVLIAFYFLAWAVETEKWYFFVLSGTMMGVAYLTKATSGVFFAIPILLFVLNPKLRSAQFIRYWAIFYCSLILVLLPWFIYLNSLGENPLYEVVRGFEIIFDPGSTKAGINQSNENYLRKIVNGPRLIGEIFSRYYEMDFSEVYLLAPVFILAWIKIIYDFIRTRNVQLSFLLSGGLLYLSLAPIQANVDFGTRHSLALYFLTFISLSAAIWPTEKTAAIGKNNSRLSMWLRSAMLFALVGLQVFVGSNSWVNALKISPPVFTLPEPDIAYSDYWGANLFAAWFTENSITEPKILASELFGNFLYFFSLDQNPMTDYPTYVSKYDTQNSSNNHDWLAIWNYHGWYGLNQVRSRIVAVSESDLLKTISENEIEYVVLSYRSYPLIYYFYSHPDFALVNGPDYYGNLIFATSGDVKPLTTYPDNLYEMLVGKATVKFLLRLEEIRPADYESLKEEYLKGVLHQSDKEIFYLQNREYPLITETNSLSNLKYIERVNDYYGMEGVLYSIGLQEEKLQWVENKEETEKLLTTMYLYIGDYDRALGYIEDAIEGVPEDHYANNLYMLSKLSKDNDLSSEKIMTIYRELIEPSPHSQLDEDLFDKFIE